MKKILLLGLIITIYSCSTTKTLNVQKIDEGTRIATYKKNSKTTPRTHDIYIYQAKEDVDVVIKIEENKIRIVPSNLDDDFELLKTTPTNKDFEFDSDGFRLADKYAFSSKLSAKQLKSLDKESYYYTDSEELGSHKNFAKTKSLKYFDNKPVFQALTIPFKIRGKKGNLSSSVSTSFNAGIAFLGHQWNRVSLTPIYNAYDKEKVSMSGYDKKTFSFSLSPFVGLTPISLKPSNTNNTITEDKSVLGFSFGGAGVFTINRVNIGLALGFDYGFNDSKNWAYQGELWTGIVLGLDIIK